MADPAPVDGNLMKALKGLKENGGQLDTSWFNGLEGLQGFQPDKDFMERR